MTLRNGSLTGVSITRNAVLEKLVDGHETVALFPELRKRDTQRLDGLTALASPIVHQNDLARLNREDALNDGIDTGTTPVKRVDIPSDFGLYL